MSVTLTADMRAVIQAAHLCFAATVSADGKPNLSPKGTIRVWDDQHLFFLDIASPGTRANLQARPWMELNVVDQLSRRGYRFFGPVTVHMGDAVFEEAIRRVHSQKSSSYSIAAVILLTVERAAPLISPGYWQVPDERAMRALWRERREALDQEFDTYLATTKPFRVSR
ncbi:MAG TPA: pyridoxamine 5'-phosphate oxidase family protein [Gemmatimonadales bacterium]|jgi:predicted pyridoxine 5'-phosphate oxidase superfamily flavin-nucleotide-binding protein|nr:pyridoxamine 5'-phosphate oxidase family protein [Gemmatimonadales bacterium]